MKQKEAGIGPFFKKNYRATFGAGKMSNRNRKIG